MASSWPARRRCPRKTDRHENDRPRGRVKPQDVSSLRDGVRARDNDPEMTSAAPTRVLVVAHRTAATPRLLDEIRARARRSRCAFTLLVPRPYWDPDTDQAAATLELALPLLEEAAGRHVDGIVDDSDPLAAVQRAIETGGFDEIIISTLPVRVSRWLRRDLPHRVESLGLPVTVVTAEQLERAVSDESAPLLRG